MSLCWTESAPLLQKKRGLVVRGWCNGDELHVAIRFLRHRTPADANKTHMAFGEHQFPYYIFHAAPRVGAKGLAARGDDERVVSDLNIVGHINATAEKAHNNSESTHGEPPRSFSLPESFSQDERLGRAERVCE